MANVGPTVATAIQHGIDVKLSRLVTGLANLQAIKSVIASAGGNLPLGYILVKAAWESNGIPTTVSKSKRDVGLYQFLLDTPEGSKKIAGKVYTFKQLQDPATATKAFVGWTNAQIASLLKTHKSYYPEGPSDWQIIKTAFLMAGIGPGATRHILNAMSPGPKSFDRLIAFTKAQANTGWFESQPEGKWGVQDPKIVAFRVILADRLMAKAQEISGVTSAIGGAAVPFGIAGTVALAGAAAVGIVLWRRRAKKQSGAIGEITELLGPPRLPKNPCTGPLKHANVPDDRFDPIQLLRGIAIEHEHTNSRMCARAIAKAHLVEHPRYYEFLEEMERKMKSGDIGCLAGLFAEGEYAERMPILPPEQVPWAVQGKARPPRAPRRLVHGSSKRSERYTMLPPPPRFGGFAGMFNDAMDDRIADASRADLETLRQDLLAMLKMGKHQLDMGGGQTVLVPVVLGKVNARLKAGGLAGFAGDSGLTCTCRGKTVVKPMQLRFLSCESFCKGK